MAAFRLSQLLSISSLVMALTTLVPAAAVAMGQEGPQPLAPVEILCDGACAGLPTTRPGPVGTPLDYELGARVTAEGLDVSIRSERSVFLLGPLRATESIRLDAGLLIRVVGDAAIEGIDDARIDLRAGDSVVLDAGSIGISPPPMIVPPVREPPGPICACISIGGPTIEPVSVSDSLPLEFFAHRDGDVFLDVSGVVLSSLEVEAALGIYVETAASSSVPEPASALLVGMGLAVLAQRRRVL